MIDETGQLLAPLKVLDFADETGFLCGKMLADLGADVIKVEPPGGDQARRIGPFYKDTPHPEKSLHWFSYNANKRGITLNLDKDEGRQLLKSLVAKTDVLIETFPPGRMDERQIGYNHLSAINPKLVYTAITPFGQTGPYCNYRATDLINMAMGGVAYLTGDQDRPPVRIGFPQSYGHAGSEAAVATMMALYQRENSGEGQLVDVSIQESLLFSTFNSTYTWFIEQVNLPRMGSFRMVGKQLTMPQIWPCKDGFVSFTVMGGPSGGKTMKALGKWMDEEGIGDEAVGGTDWAAFDFYGLTTEMVDKVVAPIRHFFMQHTRDELFQECIKRGIMLFPVATADKVTQDPHLKAKGFWQDIPHDELGEIIPYPKPPFVIDGQYLPIRRRPPLVGEHNHEVYSEFLGLSLPDMASLKLQGII